MRPPSANSWGKTVTASQEGGTEQVAERVQHLAAERRRIERERGLSGTFLWLCSDVQSWIWLSSSEIRDAKEKNKKKICPSPWRWVFSPFIHYKERALVPDGDLEMTLCESRGWLHLWFSWSMSTPWSGPRHTWSCKFCPHKSTQVMDQVGTEIYPACILLGFVLGVGWRVGVWISPEEGERFSNFLRGSSVSGGFLIGPGKVMGH